MQLSHRTVSANPDSYFFPPPDWMTSLICLNSSQTTEVRIALVTLLIHIWIWNMNNFPNKLDFNPHFLINEVYYYYLFLSNYILYDTPHTQRCIFILRALLTTHHLSISPFPLPLYNCSSRPSSFPSSAHPLTPLLLLQITLRFWSSIRHHRRTCYPSFHLTSLAHSHLSRLLLVLWSFMSVTLVIHFFVWYNIYIYIYFSELLTLSYIMVLFLEHFSPLCSCVTLYLEDITCVFLVLGMGFYRKIFNIMV